MKMTDQDTTDLTKSINHILEIKNTQAIKVHVLITKLCVLIKVLITID